MSKLFASSAGFCGLCAPACWPSVARRMMSVSSDSRDRDGAGLRGETAGCGRTGIAFIGDPPIGLSIQCGPQQVVAAPTPHLLSNLRFGNRPCLHLLTRPGTVSFVVLISPVTAHQDRNFRGLQLIRRLSVTEAKYELRGNQSPRNPRACARGFGCRLYLRLRPDRSLRGRESSRPRASEKLCP